MIEQGAFNCPIPLLFTGRSSSSTGLSIQPDAVLDAGKDFPVPDSGVLPIQGFAIDTAFGEDQWLSGVEVRPGNRDVVKEVVV